MHFHSCLPNCGKVISFSSVIGFLCDSLGIRGCISASITHKLQVLLLILLDLFHKHFQKVRCPHARLRSNLSIKWKGQLFRPLINRENAFVLSILFSVKFTVRRQVFHLGSSHLESALDATRCLRTPLISFIMTVYQLSHLLEIKLAAIENELRPAGDHSFGLFCQGLLGTCTRYGWLT